MKKLIIACTVAGLVFSIGARSADADMTINFEGLDYTQVSTGGNITPNLASVLTNDFMSDGLLFGRAGVSAGVAVVRGPYAPSSGRQSVVALDASGILRDYGSDDIYFSFVEPGMLTPGHTDYVSFTIGDGGGDLEEFQIRSYNYAGTVIDTQNVSGTARFSVTIAKPGIHHVEVDYIGQLWGYSLDDMSFNTPVSTPTPGAIVLGSIGVGIVGWLIKRRTL